jgi:hypothetical protein
MGHETPTEFQSDGCTWPTLFNDLMGRDRNKKYCRRHDFECRYGLYTWEDAREYMIDGMKQEPKWTWFRIPIIWIGLWVARDQCEDYNQPVPPEWLAWINRGYGK